MLAQDKYQAVTNEIEEIQEVRKKVDDIGYFDYAACVYPTGQADQQVHFFNEEDIAEVFFEGYRDELEEKFCEKYQEMVDKIPYPRLHIVYDE